MPTVLARDEARYDGHPEPGQAPENSCGWSRFLALAACRNARFRFLSSAGAEAATCVVLRVRRGRRMLRHVVAVVPVGRTLDLVGVARLYGGSSAGYVPAETAESLTGCAPGAIAPHTDGPGLELVLDQRLRDREEIVFADVRPDVSIALNTDDYLTLARPRTAAITA
ncbi:YbaK/EbsC family protein [Streptomyces sp. TRM 70351]|uniref:YbaK/EbsC family protein n=1 Tax=Streptomyces sp. TRM 70351 TaxID=3116552 RepID=UPI002E7BD697|nr:YbaK/EbsC family protein [Streptomyces sp. TRM 70351]MEE1929373.1 YbaK/EbsC family protein [Streptomyces sp. TRM 70351]